MSVGCSWLHNGHDVLHVARQPSRRRQGPSAAAVLPRLHAQVGLFAELHRR